MRLLALWTTLAGMAAAAPGLDEPQAIGPFLNGIFPSVTPGPTGSWAVADAFPNLTFVDPVRMVKDPVSPDHVYIVCRNGDVWRTPFNPAATNSDKVRVLDRRANTWGYWDAGMMSVCFHPDFGVPGNPNRGYVYVFYQYIPGPIANQSPDSRSYMRLSRFTVPDGEVTFDHSSEYVMIQQFDRHNWHNGGQMFFGPDRFLHVVIGDEGASNDSHGVAQKINDRLFSGILRIDVDRDPERSHPIRRQPAQVAMPAGWQQSFTQGYFIPNDNPWQDPGGGILEEFWTIGTRSPHSMHFDRGTGEIWIAEVGQGTREEITIARKGGNHQWPFREGFANGPKAKPANLIGTEVPPLFDYNRSMGGCIIGGIVYRGTTHLGTLGGKYLFGDHNTRALYSLERIEGQPPKVEYLTSVNRSGGNKRGLAGICEGPDGEAYFMELGDTGSDTGKILKLVRNGTPVADPPPLLSQTGAFSDLASLTPRAGLIPYGVNAALWTDGAVKSRWVAIPNNGTHDTPSEQVVYREEGAWSFPAGSVMVKHFALPVDGRNPSIVKPVETRFLVHGTDGAYYGVTYKWNEEGTDAHLLPGGDTRDFTVTDEQGNTGTQRWDFPSRSDCRTCHTTNAGSVLGFRSHQLNGDEFYPLTGRTANQLETWNALGIFGTSFGPRDPGQLPASVDPHDPHASLDHRVRSYLDANCSHCHHPDGVTANFDASFHTPLSLQEFVNGAVNRPFHGPEERIVKAGDPQLSLLHVRNSAVGSGQMPPLGKNVVDAAAVALIEDWILSLNQASFAPGTPGAAPVAGDDSHVAVHAKTSAIHPLENDTVATGPPGIHGIAIVHPPQHGTIRISGAQKRLIYTHDGSSARTDSFTYTLTDPHGLASAPATVTLSIPYDFAAWAEETPGAGAPESNADGDLFPDLLEFALGGLPGSGASPASNAVEIEADGNDISVVIRRPAGLSGVSYVIETSPDLTNWHDAGSPELVEETGDLEILRLESLQSLPGLSLEEGFARLRVALDGSPASFATLPLGWHTVNLTGSRTVGTPFREVPVFSSEVVEVDGTRLSVHGDPGISPDFKGFVEVITGPFSGHRFEVASASAGEITLLPSSSDTMSHAPDLAGSSIVLCAHHTLGGLFDKSKLTGSTNPAAADQVQIHVNDGTSPGHFELYYLLDARPGNPLHQWRAFLPENTNHDGRTIVSGQGVFFKRPPGAPAAKLVLTGQVRANPYVRKLHPGVNLLASPFPVPLSPRQSGLLDPSALFTSSTNFAAADQFYLHQGGAFRIFYLLDHPSLPDYWRETIASSPDSNDIPLFAPAEAAFLKRSASSPPYAIPAPWTP